MKRYERDGRWVEVGKLRHTYHNGQPCYEVDGRGDHAFYLNPTTSLLTMEEHADGWTIRYRPNDDNFQEYANELIQLGAWT